MSSPRPTTLQEVSTTIKTETKVETTTTIETTARCVPKLRHTPPPSPSNAKKLQINSYRGWDDAFGYLFTLEHIDYLNECLIGKVYVHVEKPSGHVVRIILDKPGYTARIDNLAVRTYGEIPGPDDKWMRLIIFVWEAVENET